MRGNYINVADRMIQSNCRSGETNKKIKGREKEKKNSRKPNEEKKTEDGHKLSIGSRRIANSVLSAQKRISIVPILRMGKPVLYSREYKLESTSV